MRALFAVFDCGLDRRLEPRLAHIRANLIVAFLFCGSAASATCLDDVAKFANDLCGEVSGRGSSSVVGASGELTAEGKGIVTKVLGGLGGALKGKAEIDSYENVVREQLGPQLMDLRACKSRMAEAAMKQVCGTPAASPKPPS